MSSANPKNKLRKIRIMDALENIINRQSSRFLDEPIPDREQLHKIYQAALRAPDHANLKPSRFIEVSGQGLKKLSDVFVTCLLYTSPSPRDATLSRMPSSA